MLRDTHPHYNTGTLYSYCSDNDDFKADSVGLDQSPGLRAFWAFVVFCKPVLTNKAHSFLNINDSLKEIKLEAYILYI